MKSGSLASSSCRRYLGHHCGGGIGCGHGACRQIRIREMQGGAVVCDQDKVLAELALPVMGIMAQMPLAEMAGQLEAIRSAISSLGMHFSDPLLTLVTLTGAAIPYLRICDEGLVNLKNGRTTELWI